MNQGQSYYLTLTTNDTNAGRVEFYINGSWYSQDSTYPYDFSEGSVAQANVLPLDQLMTGVNTLAVRVNGTLVADTTVTLVTSAPEPDTLSVTLYWSAPIERVNGELMSFDEIGGYEIRYRETGTSAFEKLVINNAATDQYLIEDLPNAEYEFQVATFDRSGIYSDFVTAQ